MNKDIARGKWKQLRGSVKQWWGKLTDDEIEKIDGRFEYLVGKLQEHYGYDRQRAEQEIHSHFGVKPPSF